MVDRWIVGDFTTGRLVAEVRDPISGSTWSTTLDGGSGTLVLNPAVRTHRLIGEMLRDQMGFRYYIAAFNDHDVVEYAGPVTRCTLDGTRWRFDAGTAWDYLDRRAIVSRDHWLTWRTPDDADPPLYQWHGTWRQIIAGIWQMVFNRGYLPWVRQDWLDQVELGEEWRRFFATSRRVEGEQTWLDPPIWPVGDQLEGKTTDHQWSVEMIDLETVAETLQEISRRESGVEVQIVPRWVGTFPDGNMLWQVVTGTDTVPHVSPTWAPWPLDMTAERSTRWVTEARIEGSTILTSARVLAGRGSEGGTPMVGWANNANVPGGQTLSSKWPEIDVTNTRHTSVHLLETANDIASSLVLDGAKPSLSCTVAIQDGGLPDPNLVRVGDMATVHAGWRHAFLPDGSHRMRIVSKTRNAAGTTNLGLVGLRYDDIARYRSRWEA